jgi:hypothetical protein
MMESTDAGRAARILLAWMSDAQARAALAGPGRAGALTAGQEQRLARARDELSKRPAGVDQSDLIRPLPAGMRDYLARLRADAQAADYLADGFIPALVDLSRICAFQPSVPVDQAAQRVAGVNPDDIGALAGITLPLADPPRVIPQFDQERLTFTTNLANQNLHIIGAFGGPAEDDLPPGTVSVGFHLRVITSFVQVASIQGRYFLRDGYHRCLGLLQRGVRYAPALVSSDLPLTELVPPGMLDFEAFTGDRPPVLPDHWDDGVSGQGQAAATRKVIIVRASELSVAEPSQPMVFRGPA